MQKTTLCYLLRGDEVLLAMKKFGFGVGRWNGPGGKLHPGEAITAGMVREIQEEVGLVVEEKDLEPVAKLRFYFPEPNTAWNQEVHVFFTRRWQGEPTESEEMRPQWFKKDNLPLAEMWPDDPHWLPRALSGEKLEGEFYFAADGQNFEKLDIRPISN